jgi:membrane-bound serine protease (ClpP class)
VLSSPRLPRSFLRTLAGVVALLAALLPVAFAVPQTQPAEAPTTASPIPMVSAGRQARNVAIITIHGDIDPRQVMAVSVKRRIQQAADAGADAIIFDIHTNGGEVNAVLQICEAIKASPVQNTVAWVNTRAISGGALISLACREMITNDPGVIGDAMAIQIDPVKGTTVPISDEAYRKLLPPLVASIIDSSRRYNRTFGGYIRDEYLLQAIVANDVELWWVRNKETQQEMAIDKAEFAMLFPGQAPAGPARLAGGAGQAASRSGIKSATTSAPGVPEGSKQLALAAESKSQSQGLSPDRPVLTSADAGKWENLGRVTDGTVAAIFNPDDLLYFNLAANPVKVVNGREEIVPIRSDDDLKKFMGAENLVRYDISWSENAYAFLVSPWVKGILIVIFLVALFIEMSHPGVVLPGIVALMALMALIAPPFILGMAAWWEIVAIFAGLILLAIEAFVIPGFTITGIFGFVLLFGGLISTFVPGGNVFPDTPQGKSDMLKGLTTVVLALFTAGAAIWGIAKHFGSLPVLGKLVLKSTPPDEDADSMIAAMDPDLGVDVRPGDGGITLTPMRPAGRVQVKDRVLDAVADLGFLDAGMPIRVTSVTGMRIGIEAAPPGPASSSKPPTAGPESRGTEA